MEGKRKNRKLWATVQPGLGENGNSLPNIPGHRVAQGRHQNAHWSYNSSSLLPLLLLLLPTPSFLFPSWLLLAHGFCCLTAPTTYLLFSPFSTSLPLYRLCVFILWVQTPQENTKHIMNSSTIPCTFPIPFNPWNTSLEFKEISDLPNQLVQPKTSAFVLDSSHPPPYPIPPHVLTTIPSKWMTKPSSSLHLHTITGSRPPSLLTRMSALASQPPLCPIQAIPHIAARVVF